MNLEQYQEFARRTQNGELNDAQRVQHALFGLASEVGEVHSLFQHVYQGEALDTERLAKEMGDVMWFLSELADCYGLRLDNIASENIAKLKRRFPESYSHFASINREER